MGLCIDADENKQGLDFEIRRDSVTFYLGREDIFYTDNHYLGDGEQKSIEIDKKVLAKITELCQDKEWRKKIFGGK